MQAVQYEPGLVQGGAAVYPGGVDLARQAGVGQEQSAQLLPHRAVFFPLAAHRQEVAVRVKSAAGKHLCRPGMAGDKQPQAKGKGERERTAADRGLILVLQGPGDQAGIEPRGLAADDRHGQAHGLDAVAFRQRGSTAGKVVPADYLAEHEPGHRAPLLLGGEHGQAEPAGARQIPGRMVRAEGGQGCGQLFIIDRGCAGGQGQAGETMQVEQPLETARAGDVPQPFEFRAGGQGDRAGVTEATGTDGRVRCEENADLLPVPDRGQAHRATGHNRRTTRWPFRSNCSGVRAKAAQKTPSRHPDWPGRAPTRSCPACHQNSQLQ